MEAQFENLRSKLIVSCQALEDEPLHSSFIMGRMAKAAYEGGAAGIRANTVEDILEIRKNVSLPIIGIIKEVYDNSEVYITPTLKEVDALMEIKPEIIAVDATKRIRPDGTYLKEFFEKVKETVVNLKAEIVVVGLPKNMDGSEGESAQNARAFAERLHNETGLQVDLQDERGTTITAHNFLNDTNTRGKKRKNVVDEVAATIILQNYLDKRKNSKNY